MKVGPYELLAELGRGGMGVVWKARAADGRLVALKLISPQGLGDPRLIRRFDREARAALAVVHENVVRLEDVGEAAGHRYLVFELLEGGSLRGLLRARGRLPWEDAVRLATDIARGLEAVHALGLVHRDLKPENVLLDASGRAKVADLGLVRDESRATGESVGNLTRTSELLGTLEYAAPEQLDARAVDPKADLYALGATLHELLAGAPPFAGTGLALVKKVLTETPQPIARLAPGIPRELAELVDGLLAKHPAARPSASETRARLEALAGREPSRKSPVKAIALGLVALALVAVGVVVGVTLGARPDSPRSPGPPPAPPPVAPPTLAPPLPTTQPRNAQLALARTLGKVRWRTGLGVTHSVALATVSGSLVAVAGTWGSNIAAYDAATGELLGVLHGTAGAVRSLATIERDGRVLVAAGSDLRELALCDLSGVVARPGGALEPVGRRLLEPQDARGRSNWAIAATADGRRAIAALQHGLTIVWDDLVRDLEKSRELRAGGRGVQTLERGCAISSDGRRAWTVVSEESEELTALEEWDLERSARSVVARGAVAVCAARRADVVAHAMGDGALFARCAGDPTRVGQHPGCRSVALSDDGRWLASAGDGRIETWDLAAPDLGSGRPVARMVAPSVANVALSADGRRLVGAVGDSSPIYVFDPRTGEDLRPPGSRWGPPRAVVVSPDGRRVYAASGPRVRVFDRATGEERPPLELPDQPDVAVDSLSFDDAGTKLAACRYNDRVEGGAVVWSLADGRARTRSFPAMRTASATLAGGDLIVGTDAEALWLAPEGDLATRRTHRLPAHPHAKDAKGARRQVHAVPLQDETVVVCDCGLMETVGRDGKKLGSRNASTAVAAVARVDEASFVTAGAGSVALWKRGSSTRAWDVEPGGTVVAASRAARLVALMRGESIVLLGLDGGSRLGELNVGERLTSLAFAPDGRALYGFSQRGVVLELAVTTR